jgi:hypothetical protein
MLSTALAQLHDHWADVAKQIATFRDWQSVHIDGLARKEGKTGKDSHLELFPLLLQLLLAVDCHATPPRGNYLVADIDGPTSARTSRPRST